MPLIVLRTLNKFVKRLSAADDKILRGQIQILIAKIFPFTEKSGLNMKGNFHHHQHPQPSVENQTSSLGTGAENKSPRPSPDSTSTSKKRLVAWAASTSLYRLFYPCRVTALSTFLGSAELHHQSVQSMPPG